MVILFVKINQIVRNVKISDLEEPFENEKDFQKLEGANSMINIQRARFIDSMNDILCRFSHGIHISHSDFHQNL